ncbi:recombinase family protein [Streptomyces niveus]
MGYARCSALTRELQPQLDALPKHGIPRDKVLSERIRTRFRVRPSSKPRSRSPPDKARTPHCQVIFTVYEMKRLGRDAAGRTALADHLTAHGLVLEMLPGPLPGMYDPSDPSGPGRLLFAFFASMAENERENIRESTLEGLDTATRKGKHGGRPPVITDDMPHTVLRRHANGESVVQIQLDLIMPALAGPVGQPVRLPQLRQEDPDRGDHPGVGRGLRRSSSGRSRIQFDPGAFQPVALSRRTTSPPPGSAAVHGQAVPSQIIGSTPVRGGARLLTHGRRLLQGVAVAQVQ